MTDPISLKNKRIAFVSNSAWSVYNFRLDVIRQLRETGYVVIVITPDDGYSQKLVAEGCEFVAVDFDNKTENPLRDYLFYKTLRRLYRQLQPDFIFHYVAKPNIYGSLAAGAEGIPSAAVVTGLGYPFAKRNLLFRIIRMLYKRALRNVHEVWFLNNEDAQVFMTEKIVGINKIKVLPGEGVNTNYFSVQAGDVIYPPSSLRPENSFQGKTRTAEEPYPAEENVSTKEAASVERTFPSEDADERIETTEGTSSPEKIHSAEGKYFPLSGRAERSTSTHSNADRRKSNGEPFEFLMSSRLLKSKGIFVYADAARILKRKQYNVNFSLLGFFEKNHPDSITQDDLEHWAKENLITYLGFADDVRPHLLQADCFVFPSFYNEGVPRCLMEAASMELPIITSLNRGCKEVVLNNSNGFIVNAHDPFDLADKMEKMMQLSAEDRTRMGKNGRQLVLKKFAMAKIVQEYANTLISAFETPGQI